MLDIGEACLIEADPEDLYYILRRHGGQTDGEAMRQKIEHYAYRSRLYGQDIPTLFLSELMELTAVEYVSIDVVSARVAKRFDLNRHSLAVSKRHSFDLIVNFGTTEHVMNQFNSFKVIHDAAKPGAYMFHQLPSTGYINHGYFNYNALMFKELADANHYEIVDLWLNGPNESCDIIESNRQYSASVADPSRLKNNVEGFRRAPVVNSNICVLMRKRTAAAFRVGLEVKTAAGDLHHEQPFDAEYIQPERSTLWGKFRKLLRAG